MSGRELVVTGTKLKIPHCDLSKGASISCHFLDSGFPLFVELLKVSFKTLQQKINCVIIA